MTDILICRNLGELRPALNEYSGRLRFISLVDNRDSLEIREFLNANTDARELPRGRLLRERSDGFRKKYIEFIGKLNERNHSLYWWTFRLTDKYPIAPNLCRDTAHFLLIIDLLSAGEGPLIVITDSSDLAGQVEVWGAAGAASVVNLVGHPKTWKVLLRRFTPAGLINAFGRNCLYWFLAHRYKPARNLTDDHLVIATCTHPRSFAPDHSYHDTYFGALVKHKAIQERKTIIFAWVLEQPLRQFKALRGLKSSLPVVPIEACLTLRSLLSCLLRSIHLYLRPLRLQGPVEIDGLDLSYLLKQSMDRSRQSGDFFWALRIYYCGRELARILRISRCIYPYENLVREKMLLLGIRSVSPQAIMVGYQHAAVSPSHTNFMFHEGEAKIYPFPESILTTGKVTKEWLEKEGNYPAGILEAACGLRQGVLPNGLATEWRRAVDNRISKVLVVLGSREEYVESLVFVEKSFAGTNEYQVRIRPHPMTPLEEAMKIAPLARSDFFSTSTSTLSCDLDWADVVLYSSSSVALEALSMGIPVVYMDLGDYLRPDPLFGWEEFKWSVSEPTEMATTIQNIESVPDHRFQDLQEKGRRYTLDYLSPVSDSAVRAFLGV